MVYAFYRLIDHFIEISDAFSEDEIQEILIPASLRLPDFHDLIWKYREFLVSNHVWNCEDLGMAVMQLLVCGFQMSYVSEYLSMSSALIICSQTAKRADVGEYAPAAVFSEPYEVQRLHAR